MKLKYEELPGSKKYNFKTLKKYGVSKMEKTNKAKEDYKNSRNKHNQEIAKLKNTIKKARGDIKKHKLLIKQAKIVYKLKR